jgi:hypothetical protein
MLAPGEGTQIFSSAAGVLLLLACWLALAAAVGSGVAYSSNLRW